MSILQIKNFKFRIDNEEAKPYFTNDVVTHSNLTTKQSELKNKKEEDKTPQDRRVLKWIEKTLTDKAKEIYDRNEVKGQTSPENGHINTHKKDNGTKPSEISSVYEPLMEETLSNEIKEIKYLIEYLTNNNKNNII